MPIFIVKNKTRGEAQLICKVTKPPPLSVDTGVKDLILIIH